jgi:hypothetical protein
MKKIFIVLSILSLGFGGVAQATMVDRISYTAPGAGLSIDAWGGTSSGLISVDIPAGGQVYKSYLYSADVWGSGLSNVSLDGTTLISSAASKLDVGARQGNSPNENIWDVTSIVNSVVGGGSGLFNISVAEFGYLDGEILATLYNVPSAPVSTAFIFDGELASGGDSFDINLGTPIDKTDPNFQALLSLGISYSYQPAGQYSRIDVNGQRLTTSAGGQDDGGGYNGGLITAGGIGDSPDNPANPYATDGAGPRYDDELYSLLAYINNGDTVIHFDTNNPSFDDNVFFLGFTTLGRASIDNPQGDVVDDDNGGPAIPEPATMALLGSGLLGFAGIQRRKRG